MMPEAASEASESKPPSRVPDAVWISLGTIAATLVVLGSIYLLMMVRQDSRTHEAELHILRVIGGQAYTRDELFGVMYEGTADLDIDEHDRLEAFDRLVRGHFVMWVIRDLEDKRGKGVLHPVRLYFSDPDALDRLDKSRGTLPSLIHTLIQSPNFQPSAGTPASESR
jgi:hypothetical protein